MLARTALLAFFEDLWSVLRSRGESRVGTSASGRKIAKMVGLGARELPSSDAKRRELRRQADLSPRWPVVLLNDRM
jgi:hypothetical protein